ncbi:MAG: dihydrofolate reductase family protein [archaeon]
MYIVVNCAMSLDGRIEGEFSNDLDWERVYALRAECDAIMAGINTVIKDDPRLSAHGYGKDPMIVVVDSRCRIPLSARVFEGDVVVGVCSGADTSKISKKARVVVCGTDEVDLKMLVSELSKMGVRKLMVEGGGTLISAMLDSGLVDEVCVAVAPVVLGRGVRFVEKELSKDVKFGLYDVIRLDDVVVLKYKVLK